MEAWNGKAECRQDHGGQAAGGPGLVERRPADIFGEELAGEGRPFGGVGGLKVKAKVKVKRLRETMSARIKAVPL